MEYIPLNQVIKHIFSRKKAVSEKNGWAAKMRCLRFCLSSYALNHSSNVSYRPLKNDEKVNKKSKQMISVQVLIAVIFYKKFPDCRKSLCFVVSLYVPQLIVKKYLSLRDFDRYVAPVWQSEAQILAALNSFLGWQL